MTLSSFQGAAVDCRSCTWTSEKLSSSFFTGIIEYGNKTLPNDECLMSQYGQPVSIDAPAVNASLQYHLGLQTGPIVIKLKAR